MIPRATSKILAVLSHEAVASCCPSGENDSATTQSACPVNTASSAPVSPAYSRTELSRNATAITVPAPAGSDSASFCLFDARKPNDDDE